MGPSGVAFGRRRQPLRRRHPQQPHSEVSPLRAPSCRPSVRWDPPKGQLRLPWGLTVAPKPRPVCCGTGATTGYSGSRPKETSSRTYGTSGRGDGELRRPSGVAVDERDRVYVSDWGKREGTGARQRTAARFQVLRGEAYPVQSGRPASWRPTLRRRRPGPRPT